MPNVFFTCLDDDFSRALAELFTKNGYNVTTELMPEIEYFIDTRDYWDPDDNRSVGDGVDMEAAARSYHENVCVPLAKLETVMPNMVGKHRICFLNSRNSSINYSTAVTGFGHNMSKAAMNQILVLSKNGLLSKGYTFRLFDPLKGELAPEKAAASAFVYFTRDRYNDGPDNLFRNDENNLVVRDALGREIPW